MSSFNINNAIMGINIIPSGTNETIKISSNNKVGINVQNAPEYNLDVNGTVGISGEITAIIDGGGVT
jgi:hypothetical protein